ncbi:PEP-CTERM sorting domain-containing protein [Agarivorans sp. MS3-6]
MSDILTISLVALNHALYTIEKYTFSYMACLLLYIDIQYLAGKCSSMKLTNFITTLFTLLLFSISTAKATLITEDFTTGSYTYSDNVLATAENIQFSHDLYSFNDGFFQLGGGVQSFYGENNMFFTFNNAAFLQSIQFAEAYSTTLTATNLNVYLYNTSGDQLSVSNFDLSPLLSTIDFSTNDVSKVEIEFTGVGLDYYGVGREHLWYRMDNIVYEPAASQPQLTVPEPSTFILSILALFGLASTRKKALIA